MLLKQTCKLPRTVLAAVFLCRAVMGQTHAQPSATRDLLEGDIANVAESVHKFASTEDAGDGDLALHSLQRLSIGPTCVSEDRPLQFWEVKVENGQPCPHMDRPDAKYIPRLTTLWLRVFAALDKAEADHLNRPPVTQVGAPAEFGVPSPYMGQVPPSQIKDPVARSKYEKAIAENEKRRLESFQYARTRRLKDLAASMFWGWPGSYPRNILSRDEVAKEAARLGCTPHRVEMIRAAIFPSLTQFAPPEDHPTIQSFDPRSASSSSHLP